VNVIASIVLLDERLPPDVQTTRTIFQIPQTAKTDIAITPPVTSIGKKRVQVKSPAADITPH
jgi:hypothetical protein